MIIDCRCRPPTKELLPFFKSAFNDRVLRRGAQFERPTSVIQESEELFWQEFQEAGITYGVVCFRNTPGLPFGQVPNEHVAQLVARYPEKLIGIAAIDPSNQLHDAQREIERSIKVLGLRGVAMEPGVVKPSMMYNDQRLYPIYELCTQLDVPIFLLTGPWSGYRLDHTNPITIEDVARDFPKLDIVCAHACWPYVMEMIGVALRRRNIYVQPDGFNFRAGGNVLMEAANDMLQDQYLFSSGYPGAPMKAIVEAYNKFPLTYRDKIMYHNAQRVLRLDKK